MNGFGGLNGVVKGLGDNGTRPDATQDTSVGEVSNCGGVATADTTSHRPAMASSGLKLAI
jgi:hypothetical protein